MTELSQRRAGGVRSKHSSNFSLQDSGVQDFYNVKKSKMNHSTKLLKTAKNIMKNLNKRVSIVEKTAESVED